MPAYGTVPWDELAAAVGEATGATFHCDPTLYIGHQMCGINMNSLNRIVSKFVASAMKPKMTEEAFRGQVVQILAEATACMTLNDFNECVEKIVKLLDVK